jgi:UDP-glucose 4-epimerase
MKKVLVTGGAGFIGSNLIPLLIEKGYFVTVLDNLSSGKIENLNRVKNNPNFKFISGDIRNKADVSGALTEIDTIVHLAAIIDVSESVKNPSLVHDVNVTGTLNVLNEAIKIGVNKIVFASSTSVYGDVKTLPIKENTPLHPISPYAASKAASEAYLTAFSHCYNIDTIALRFFNVYGPRNENSPYSGVISKFLKKALNNQPLTIEGDGEQNRDFIHVNDIIQALLKSVEASNLRGEVFNVCTGKPTSINQLTEALSIVLNKKLTIEHACARVGDIRYSYGEITKAKTKLNFQAKTSLIQGLTLLLEENR